MSNDRQIPLSTAVAWSRKPRDDPSVRRSELGDERASFGRAP